MRFRINRSVFRLMVTRNLAVPTAQSNEVVPGSVYLISPWAPGLWFPSQRSEVS